MEIYVMCGIPGSGKSTWIKNNLPKDILIISRDLIRATIGISESPEHKAVCTSTEEVLVTKLENEAIKNRRDTFSEFEKGYKSTINHTEKVFNDHLKDTKDKAKKVQPVYNKLWGFFDKKETEKAYEPVKEEFGNIVKEGEMGDVFYIIYEGECNATKLIKNKETIMKKYTYGNYFGERALVKGEPRYENIIAFSDIVRVFTLDRDSFNRLLGPIEDILKRNIEKYQL